ncbi:glutathione S-transferase family protein [Elstera cyanobacteriorum]|uniref:Glutathione S-transferase n=1 Tax=Elstera cyanobacteriorum TaxID=2022747 RepID=A0A255XIN9_9PROT|nr:glutathione S-transferase family protein [Elstera cyanobacteriorum]MCK6442976.1 glutathione S-transferase family protein [Elstera cyanobacteriorum]OYQ16839.1 glutathione S-transferase [Elstera cyanobacteriorum]GFZ88896.1 glutathione S-transferase [Elstera cyanobacteriorum]
MMLLFHQFVSPGSRKIRLMLKEKNLEFDLQIEKTWERRPEFLALNPAGEVPVLLFEPGGHPISDATAIAEFIEESFPDRPLLGQTALERAEIRRLIGWFDVKFNREVTQNLVDEKITKRLTGIGTPNSQAIKAGYANIHYHLDYIAYLSDRRSYLAGADFSLADVTAAAHLSCVDYLGDVPWDQHPGAKEWYARVKSRPSFRPLLADHIPGMPPPRHYADLDF